MSTAPAYGSACSISYNRDSAKSLDLWDPFARCVSTLTLDSCIYAQARISLEMTDSKPQKCTSHLHAHGDKRTCARAHTFMHAHHTTQTTKVRLLYLAQ